jgi:hypothetical protein
MEFGIQVDNYNQSSLYRVLSGLKAESMLPSAGAPQ